LDVLVQLERAERREMLVGVAPTCP
jgi:hypothetical protein